MSLPVRSLLLLLAVTFAAALHAEKPQMITRTFKVPPDYLSAGRGAPSSAAPAAPAAPADPFAEPEAPAPSQKRKTVREVLEEEGISFPEGAGVAFDPVTGLLTVTNTHENIELVGAWFDAIVGSNPRVVACSVTVIEGPGELIRQAVAAASRKTDARQELASLLSHTKNPESKVRVVGDAFLETKSGTRASSDAVREHIYVSELDLDSKSRSSVVQEMRYAGLRLEYEPTIGADGVHIESTVSIELHPAPPSERQVSVTEPVTGGTAEFPTAEIHSARFVTGITISSGSTKLIGVTKPVGTPAEKEDVLWAAFVTATAHRVDATVSAKATEFAPSHPVPPGMRAVALPVPRGLLQDPMLWIESGEPPRSLPLQKWFEASGVPQVKGASVRLTDDAVKVINTPDNIASMATLIDEQLDHHARTVAITVHTVQAPAALLREWAHRPSPTADDTAMFTAVEEAVERDEATFISSSFVETKSGMRARQQAAREHVYLSEFGTNAKGQPHTAFEMRMVGSILEFEPTVSADGHAVEFIYSHELHPAAPDTRRDHFRDPATGKAFDMPVVDFHSAKTVTGTTLTPGGTRLISLNKPTGNSNDDVLWATFLKCDLVPQIPASRPVAEEPEQRASPSDNPKAWNTVRIRVPPDFLSIGGTGQLNTAKMILESQGIAFPEGATATFSPATSMLIVKNTNENLDLVEAFFETILYDPPTSIAFTTHVLQGPGTLLRRITAQAASRSDHRAALDELLAAVKTGTVLHLNTAHIETKSGTHATSEQASEHNAVSEVGVSEDGTPFFHQEMRKVGFLLELEPLVFADGATVELNIAPEFHTAAPYEHREHVIDTQGRRLEFPLTDYHVAKTTTTIFLIDGTARLISLHKPTGKPEFEKEDILQAIFITCDILRAGE